MNTDDMITYLDQQINICKADIIIGHAFVTQAPSYFQTTNKLIKQGLDETAEHMHLLIKIRDTILGN